PLLLTDDRHHRLTIELRVVEAVEQMGGTAAGGGQADPHLGGELGVAAGHEGSHLLVAGLDELRTLVRAVQGAEEGIDAVSRIAEDPMGPPLSQAGQDVVGDRWHEAPPSVGSPGTPDAYPLGEE